MKKLLSLLAVVFTLGLTTVALDAEAAKRLGGSVAATEALLKNLDEHAQRLPPPAPRPSSSGR